MDDQEAERTTGTDPAACPAEACDGRGRYDGRILIGYRGIYTCEKCGVRWQDMTEEPSTKATTEVRLEEDDGYE